MFEDHKYRWRETYFVLFGTGDRPKLKTVEKALSRLNEHYELTNLRADDSGLFDSLTLLSPDDFSALDICYTTGPEVLEDAANLAEEMELAGCEAGGTDSLNRIRQCDSRFDVLHFEQVPESPEDDEEVLDPSALLLVLGALTKITGGVAIDPQAGTFVSDED
jgi:hypothetical protein